MLFLQGNHRHEFSMLQHVTACCNASFLHHYQGSVDFNTVNIHRTVWVYFLIFPRSRDGMLSDMIFKDHIIQFTPLSLGSVLENTALGTVFSDTLPIGNIRNTSSALEIALGLRPRAISRASGCKIPAFGKSLGPRGCIFQYIPPLVSVRTQYCNKTMFFEEVLYVKINSVL